MIDALIMIMIIELIPSRVVCEASLKALNCQRPLEILGIKPAGLADAHIRDVGLQHAI
jgi:hypothetical protein